MTLLPLADAAIILPVFGLIGISLSLIGSFTPDLLVNQIIFFLIGILLVSLFARLDYKVLPKLFGFIYIFTLLFLLASLFGPQVRGANRWIEVFGFRILQPSEVIKPFIIVILAVLIAREKKRNFSLFWKHLFFIIPFILLIFKQPDLGNVIIYLITFIFLEIVAGLSIKYILFILFTCFALIPSFWVIMKPYQKTRLLTFFNPNPDYAGAGYNALQALIAIGSGQLFGLGLGRGAQSHLLFLPEYHTDFVFASLGEELGFVGGALIILFYLILFLRILVIARSCEDYFGKLLCLGIFIQLFTQVFINIGMNLGLLPITGITLPLVSYGGSSIVSTFIDLGIVLSVARINKKTHPIVIR